MNTIIDQLRRFSGNNIDRIIENMELEVVNSPRTLFFSKFSMIIVWINSLFALSQTPMDLNFLLLLTAIPAFFIKVRARKRLTGNSFCRRAAAILRVPQVSRLLV